MTKETYDIKMRQITESYEQAKRELYKEYAYANNPYKVGDIVSDHIGAVRIEEIKVYISGGSGMPQCVYIGTDLTKSGEPAKKQKHTQVFQQNISK